MTARMFERGAGRLAPLLFLFTASCLDTIAGDCRLVVGRIYLHYSHGDNGYQLDFADSSFSCRGGGTLEPVIEDEILEVWGNDSLLYVCGRDRGDTNYYSIRHDHGEVVTARKKIGSLVPGGVHKYHWRKP